MCYKIKDSITSHLDNSIDNRNAKLEAKIDDTDNLIDKCERKFQLFVAHKAHCANQKRKKENS